MSIDDILDAATHATGGEWRIRKAVDESGDYPFPTYDILAVFPYGPQGIGTAHQDPYNAILFAGAKQLAVEVKRLRAEVLGFKGEAGLSKPEQGGEG
jgi:hypothetical protein